MQPFVERLCRSAEDLPVVVTTIALRMGETYQAVKNWFHRGVPVARCAEFERACDQRVRRWHLRPDDWHAIWPELVGAKGAPRVKVAA